MALVSGTVLFDGGTLFYNNETLRNIAFPTVVAIHPSDAESLSLAEGTPVSVRSPYGALDLAVKVDAQVQPGTAWIPESLPGAPVGALLNGRVVQGVKIEKRD
ncbi:MAG: molybdopterin dinucleotide binding domain-containing protein [Caldilineaceae bacterium]